MHNQRRTSLQRRYFIFTLAFSLVILAVTLGLTYYSAVTSVSASTTQYLSTYLQFADQAFTARVNSAKLLSHTIAGDRQIVQSAIAAASREGSYDWFMEQLRMRSYLDGLMADKKYVKRLAVVMESGSIYQSSSDSPMYWRDLTDELKAALHFTVLITRYDEEQNVFLLTRPVMAQGTVKGVVYMELDADALFAEYALQPLNSTSLFLFDAQDRLIHTAGPQMPQNIAQDALHWETGLHWVNGHPYCLLKQPGGTMDITVIGMITLEELLGDALRLGRWMLVMAVAAALVTAGIAELFSRSLFGNLNILMDCMRAVRQGDLTQRAVVSTRDEISDAADAFNEMMQKINTLMEDIRRQETAKREAEQQVLEAQIQPHFVYNSISAMQYAAGLRGQTDIEQAAAALGELMRSVLGNHNEWITLWEERTYIEQYIVLQRFKFKQHFTLTWDVEEKLWGMLLPKLLLQPLVENALLHGIGAKQNGEITVSAHEQGDRVLLQVTDDGKGITPGDVERLMEAKPAAMRHVGIGNVRERIATCYGDRGTFNVVSVPGSFTCVEIRLPLGEGGDGYGAASGARG